MEKNEETQLVAAAKKGQRDAIGSLVERYEREIFFFIYKMTGNMEDARDLTQDVFIKVFRKISGFNGRSTFRTWLYKVATHHTLNFLARRPPGGSEKALEGLPDPSPTSLERIVRADLRHHIRSAIQTLPRQQRAIVTLRALEGLRYILLSRE